ncbi:MAG: hypothetical protein LBT81_05020 [Helicobacteraceae bacterium]|jgi:hypothetical protein|nr:hypothetical protein [Helicobacteraceae bacterium]
MRKNAFSMIETIVTVVLLGLIFGTLPILMSTVVEVEEDALEGEALYHASALMNRIVSLQYNNKVKDSIVGHSTINANCTYLLDSANVREGTALLRPERFRRCDITTTPDGLSWEESQTGINQFNGARFDMEERGFRLDVQVGYLADNTLLPPVGVITTVWTLDQSATAGVTGSNFILVTITARNRQTGNEIGVLHYVASNIGASL